MLRALYSSATGMKAQEYLIDVTSNNLANVNTNGFKRSQLDFADLLYSTERQAGSEVVAGQPSPVGMQIGSGVRPMGTTKNFSTGTFEQTGIPTDIAIEGDGFFQVQVGDQIRFTRDGAFRVDGQTGNLVTVDGYLLEPAINIPQGATDVNIGPSGVVTASINGQTQPLGSILVQQFVNPAGLSNEGNNQYSETVASGAPIQGNPGENGLGTLRGGYLEKSNVEVVTELIALITAQRAYEINSRAIRAGDEMLSTTTDLVR
jgi:flagellar basal-body rod protein FlgG